MKTRVQTGREFMVELFGEELANTFVRFDLNDIKEVINEANNVKQYSGGVDLYADGWSDAVSFIEARLGYIQSRKPSNTTMTY